MEKVLYTDTVENSAEVGTTTEIRIFSPTEADKVRYAPFNQMLVVNNSGVDVEVRPNGDATKKLVVTAGDGLSDNSNAFFYLTLYNRDGSTVINANEVIITVRKVIEG